jgi:hypothetical protein
MVHIPDVTAGDAQCAINSCSLTRQEIAASFVDETLHLTCAPVDLLKKRTMTGQRRPVYAALIRQLIGQNRDGGYDLRDRDRRGQMEHARPSDAGVNGQQHDQEDGRKQQAT